MSAAEDARRYAANLERMDLEAARLVEDVRRIDEPGAQLCERVAELAGIAGRYMRGKYQAPSSASAPERRTVCVTRESLADASGPGYVTTPPTSAPRATAEELRDPYLDGIVARGLPTSPDPDAPGWDANGSPVP